MNTKKALSALTKGQNKSEGILEPKLAERAGEYLERWNQREAGIIRKKNQDGLNVPMLETLRKKIAKVAGDVDYAMPVAMRFYAYQAMKTAASASPKDRGIARAAHDLESLWTQDPMGSLTLGQVMSLREHLKDSYPRSKVAKTLDATIARVGYASLPVAKLARIAQQIQTQEDFDHLIKVAGLEGNRPEQIKGRTLVRELVAMRGTTLTPEFVADDRSNLERVTAQLVKNEPALAPEMPGDDIGMDELGPGDESLLPNEPEIAPPEMMGPPGGEGEGEVSDVVPMIEEVEQHIEDTMPPEAENFVDTELAEGQSMPGTAEWGFEEAEEGHSEAPPSKVWQDEELAEHGLGGGEMGGPPMDAPMGGPPMMNGPPGMESPMPGGPGEDPLDHGLSGKLAQKRANIQAAMGIRTAQHHPGFGGMNSPQEGSPIQNDTQHALDELEQQFKAGLMTAKEYLLKRRSMEENARFKSTPPDRMNELLNHPRDPMTPQDVANRADPLNKMADGLDAPKPDADGQIERMNNDAPDRSKDGIKELTKDESTGVDCKSAFTMTAAEIEAALIDRGEEVRYGGACLRINESDEIELWHKGAGVACDLMDLDIAITDFIAVTASEHKAAQPQAFYSITQLVPVPCGRCASMDYFETTQDPHDLYACGECGHRTMAAMISDMVRHGQLQCKTAISVQIPMDTEISKVSQFNQLMGRAAKVPGTEIKRGELGQWHIMVASPEGAELFVEALSELGAAVKTAQFDPGAVAAPGSADQAIPQDVMPQGAAAPQAAPQKPGAGDSAAVPGAATPGGITQDNIKAAFTHYKALDLPFPEAMAQFQKDYKEKIAAGWRSPDMDITVIDIARQLYTSSGAAPTSGQVLAAKAAFRLAFKDPKVNPQQPDQVSVQKFPGGPNSDEKDQDRMHAPKPKAKGKQPGAGDQSGTTAPPTEMGKTNEDTHPSGLSAPKPPADGHVKGKAGDQPGTKAVPDKELGKDSDHDQKSEIPVPGKFGPRPKHGGKVQK